MYDCCWIVSHSASGVLGPTILYPRVPGISSSLDTITTTQGMNIATWVACDSDALCAELQANAPHLLRLRLYPSDCDFNASVAFWQGLRGNGTAGLGCAMDAIKPSTVLRGRGVGLTSLAWPRPAAALNESVLHAAAVGVDAIVSPDPKTSALLLGLTVPPPPPPPPSPGVTISQFNVSVPRVVGGWLAVVQPSSISRVRLLPPFGYSGCEGREGTARSAQGYGCKFATNAGFFDERNEACEGGLIADGRDIAPPSSAHSSEAGFGIDWNGVAAAQYVPVENVSARWVGKFRM